MTAMKDLLHPDLVPAVENYPLPGLSDDTLASARAMRLMADMAVDGVEHADHLVPGDPPVPIRVHRPEGVDGALPCYVSMHGGGYVMGTYRMDNFTFADLSPRLGIVGVSIEYRLAPETPYPGPLEDCYAALRWTYAHAEELGIDRTRIGVGGGSAGGGLAAALALLARDRGEVPLAFQLLDCPMLDDRQITASSQQDGLPVFTRESNRFGWQCYLGDRYGTDDVPYTAAPARAIDLSGLPPAFVSVGALDGFLDEDVDYALRLSHAGVPTELHVYPGLPHGYQLAPHCEAVQQAKRDRDDWLARVTRSR